MSFTWNSIHRGLVRSASTLTFSNTFADMRHQHPVLARFIDVTALLDHLHHGTASSDAKNEVLAALITIAQSPSAASDIAVTILILALWPGLDAVFHRQGRRVEARNELTSGILDRVVEEVRRLDLGSVRRIAATILMNVERDLARADARERCRRRLAVDIDLFGDASVDPSPMRGLLLRDVARHAGEDGRIVISVAVDGFTQAEVATSIGLSEAATRKRYQRAARHLRDAFSDEGLSRSVPEPGLSRSSADALNAKKGTGRMPLTNEADDLARLPGLYRRWEFGEVMETRRTYRLEEAGAHADGTPLVSIFTDAAKHESDDEHVRGRGVDTGGV